MKVGDKVKLTAAGRGILETDIAVGLESVGTIRDVLNCRTRGVKHNLYIVDFPDSPDVCLDYAFTDREVEVIE